MAQSHIIKYCKLVEGLYKKTLEGQLNWELDFGDEVYLETEGFQIYLESFRGSDGEPFESIEIRRDGKTVDKFNDAVLSSEPTGIPNVSYYSLMQDLRIAARRKAIGADDAIDHILKSLD